MAHRNLIPLTLAAALLGCKVEENPLPPSVDEGVALRRMADCDDLRGRLTDTLTDQVLGWGGRYYPPMAEDGENDAADGGGGEPTDYTGTNVQEAGVDELDLVKTNGTHLFIAQDRALRIVKSWPAEESELLASVELDGWARGLFLVGDDTVVVLEDVSGYVQLDERWWSALRARVIDVSDPAAPVALHTIDLQGWLTDARMIEDQIYLVVNQYMDFPQEVWEAAWNAAAGLPWPEDGTEADWEAARLRNREQLRPVIAGLVAGTDLADVLPGWRADTADTFNALYACEDIYTPEQLTPLAMLSVARLDPEAGTLSATGLMSDGWTVYASTTALYVAQTSAWWWGWTEDVGKSHIHRFDLTGASPAYTGSGSVTGWLYDQFAMSEFEGSLRVVTTDFGWWGWGGGVAVDVGVEEDVSDSPGTGGGGSDGSTGSDEDEAPPSEGGDVPPSEGDDTPVGDTDAPDEPDEPEVPAEEPPQPANHVFVLQAHPTTGALEVVGHVDGIAPGETVQSVRMMGEKGYVVTFRQTDPLFTLDLSDPTAPAVVGELHMPGYSAYLHPLGDDHLIGVGMAGLDTGELTGLAVNLFDVSDLSAPRLVEQFELDPGDNAWSWSEAMWDHHAFTYHRDVLTLPAYTWSWDEESGLYDGFSGTVSLHVTVADGISELGRVDHRDLVADSACIYDIWWAEDREGGDVVEGDDGDREEIGDEGGVDPEPGEDTPPDDGGEEPEPTEPDDTWSYCDWDYGYWYAQVRRSVYIEDNLFTISDYGVKVNDLNAPDTQIARVLFYPESAE